MVEDAFRLGGVSIYRFHAKRLEALRFFSRFLSSRSPSFLLPVPDPKPRTCSAHDSLLKATAARKSQRADDKKYAQEKAQQENKHLSEVWLMHPVNALLLILRSCYPGRTISAGSSDARLANPKTSVFFPHSCHFFRSSHGYKNSEASQAQNIARAGSFNPTCLTHQPFL
jgi:hypothetical protein